MVRQLFVGILSQLKDIQTIRGSHTPGYMLENIEKELLLDPTYVRKTPPGYPLDLPEKHGLRRLRRPVSGTYENSRIRVGITTLHLRQVNTNRNLESVFLCDISDSEQIKIDKATSFGDKEASYLLLHENGVVSACYMRHGSPFALVSSWYPPGKMEYGGLPYPSEKGDIAVDMLKVAQKTQMLPTKKFSKIPDLVTLAIKTYLHSKK